MEGKLNEDPRMKLTIRERIQSLKNPTNEDLIELWEYSIKVILEKGNLFSGHGDRIAVFNEKYTLEEKIMYCLIKLYSIKENRNYSVSYASDKRPSLKIYYRGEADELLERDEKEIVAEAKRIVQEYNEEKIKK